MSRVEAAAAMDRLPWLADEPEVRASRRRGVSAIGWILAVVLLVGAVAFWTGVCFTWNLHSLPTGSVTVKP